ncbi:helix-turn-helix domain-containing protein [Streptomyces sp. NPDC007205]|uniref:winged helix-turn-helix transcriptional regulator n=1 Tax=Streptomyces sp. NPDC007205 TaxID=3154316 RepID=UPI0033C8DD6D
MAATVDESAHWHTPQERAAFVRDILDRIGDKWSVIVICRLGKEPHRFNELRRASDGITQRMLSSTLRALERDGIVTRTVHPTVPPRVEYALTETGRTLLDVVKALARWTDQHVDVIRAARADYDQRTHATA